MTLLRKPTSVAGLTRFTRHRYNSVKNLDDQRFVYHISIIDYLQDWNKKKNAENFIKSTFMGKDSKRLSAVEPDWY